MALSQPSLILYGYQVTVLNAALDFYNVNTQTPSTAFQGTLTQGYYSLTGLLAEIARVLNTADPSNTYTATVNRNILGGLENRVTISSSGSFFSIIFGSSMRAATSCASLIGFLPADYTGSTTYTGSSTSGTRVISELPAYTFLAPTFSEKVFGNVNISAIGDKEAIVYQIQQFWQGNFRYEPNTKNNKKVETDWIPFLNWSIQQRPLEFTPDYTDPTTFYEGTLETTAADGRALAFNMVEMIPSFPNFYETGMLRFRLKIVPPSFLL